MIRENPLKNVARVPLSSLKKAEKITGLAPVKDFDPRGKAAMDDERISWVRISEAVLIRDDYKCRVCSKSDIVSMDSSNSKVHMSVEVHHILPRSRKGGDVFENLITLCVNCHHLTFGNDYSGIPLKNSMNLDNFPFIRNIALPSTFTFQDKRTGKIVFLKDYARKEGIDESCSITESQGSEIEASLFEVSDSDYTKLVRYLEDEFQVDDYRTLIFRYGVNSLPARVFESSGQLFL